MEKKGMNKKVIMIMFTIFSVSVMLVSCNKQSADPESCSSEEIDLIGQRHNEGLDLVLEEFETSDLAKKFAYKKSANIALTTQDKLEMARFLDEQAKEFIAQHPLMYKGKQVEIEPMQFSDGQLLDFFDTDLDDVMSTGLQLKYFTLLEDAHFIKERLGNAFVQEVDRIIEEARIEIIDEGELVPVLTMGSVLKYSNEYWHSDMKTKGWVSIALADATNGGNAALWGAAVAGPLGAVVVGLNGAIIGSATAYLVSQI